IRVSLTAEPVEEVPVAYEILQVLDVRQKGTVLVSCPSCGRCEIDLFPLVGEVEDYLAKIDEPLKVAVMGCVVNGPGESKDADIGLAGGRGRGVIFAKGEILETLDEHEFLPHLKAGIDRLVEEREAARAKETVAS
ncbi:MAG: flavodoxin-dependent (E)-4-hydroxy-3-methylbut-2-enyl-diphosphate synthase, partial [Chloroflexi bacterium]|nr:flavodoxin-dependent (E)-4-hydroxy-3-methylbut-2-enyl-diphosphate synthase [Chloroflexota bacterium]